MQIAAIYSSHPVTVRNQLRDPSPKGLGEAIYIPVPDASHWFASSGFRSRRLSEVENILAFLETSLLQIIPDIRASHNGIAGRADLSSAV